MAGPVAARDVRPDPGTEPAPAPRATAHLTAAIASGDEDAFADFYDAWFDRAFALARKISRRDESFCLDVVQDCMLRVIRSLPPLRTERSVQAWMARALFTATVDRLRQDQRRRRRERRAATPEAAHVARDPRISAEEDEQLRWVLQRLAELPEQDRQMVLARFAGDQTLEAIGRAMGITCNAAHGRIRRILQRLRHRASEVFGD